MAPMAGYACWLTSTTFQGYYLRGRLISRVWNLLADRENDQGLVIRALEDVLQQPLLVDLQPINGFLVLLSRNVRRGVPEMVSA